MVPAGMPELPVTVQIPGLADGDYRVVSYDTTAGRVIGQSGATSSHGQLASAVRLGGDLALVITPA